MYMYTGSSGATRLNSLTPAINMHAVLYIYYIYVTFHNPVQMHIFLLPEVNLVVDSR